MSVGLDGRIGWMEMDVDRLGVQSTLALLPRCLGSQCTMRKIRNTCEIHPFFSPYKYMFSSIIHKN